MSKLIDLTGQEFGRLVVIKRAPNNKRRTFWVCKCDCGNEKVINGYSLVSGYTKSCGCLHRESCIERFTKHGYAVGGGTTEYRMYHDAKKRAKRDNIPFDISIEDIIIPQFCPVFTDMPLCCNAGTPRDNSPSLDRLNPSIGYIKGNINVISYKANTIKQSATSNDIRRVADWVLEMEVKSTGRVVG